MAGIKCGWCGATTWLPNPTTSIGEQLIYDMADLNKHKRREHLDRWNEEKNKQDHKRREKEIFKDRQYQARLAHAKALPRVIFELGGLNPAEYRLTRPLGGAPGPLNSYAIKYRERPTDHLRHPDPVVITAYDQVQEQIATLQTAAAGMLQAAYESGTQVTQAEIEAWSLESDQVEREVQ